MNQLNWKRSSFCGGGGNNRVKLAICDDDDTATRDSVYPDQDIRVSRAALTAFITGVRQAGSLPDSQS